jgi:L-asparaginase II
VNPILVEVLRGGCVESAHAGAVAVLDADGAVVASLGDISRPVFPRSAVKLLQALPLVESGAADRLGLGAEELALACASHNGESEHVRTAAAMLAKAGLDAAALECGTHWPYFELAQRALAQRGERPSALHNNCSGKHAGMLLATKLMDVPSSRYIDPDHPAQVLMRLTVAEFAGLDPEEIPIAIDGCGVPAFYLSLHRTAYAYARMMATSEGPTAPGALERYAASASHIVEAMTTFPYFVGGAATITTPLMESFGGELLAKEGAEGFYAMAISPSLRSELTDRLELAEDVALGVAIKIHDGGTSDRARYPAILRTLEILGIDISARRGLQKYRETGIRNHAGTLVGDVRAEFDLEFI